MAGTVRRNRKINNIQVVIDALRSDGPSSQAALSRKTGLSPATVNNIVQALRADGTADVKRLNGREALVELTARQSAIISVRVGAGSIEGAFLDFSGTRRTDAFHRGSGGPAAVIDMVKTLTCDDQDGQAPISAIAVGIEAPIDRSTGAIAAWAATRLAGWKDVNVQETLERELGVQVIVDNDANFDALAEWSWGVGRGADCFLNITCSEGIGSGLIIDGKIHRGSDGMAGQIGHTVVEHGGEVCFCGNRGCLSTLVSERALLNVLRDTDSPKASLKAVIEAAREGDAACQRVLFEAGRYLGRALANAAKILSPKIICVGGLLGDAKPFVLDGLNSSIEVTSLRIVSPSIKFAASELGGTSKLLGGVAAALVAIGQGVSELSPWMVTKASSAEAVPS